MTFRFTLRQRVCLFNIGVKFGYLTRKQEHAAKFDNKFLTWKSELDREEPLEERRKLASFGPGCPGSEREQFV